jgi:membrane fusion protein, adhesin transport system
LSLKPVTQNKLTSVSADLLEPPSAVERTMVYAVGATFALSLGWSMLAPVLEVASASGVVVPENHVQLVQSLEGGAVDTIYARVGQHVDKGDVFLRLDPTTPRAMREDMLQQLQSLEISAARLAGLLDGAAPDFPTALPQQADQIAQSQQQYETAKRELDSMLESFDSQISQRKLELDEVRSRAKTATRARRLADEELANFRKLGRARAAGRSEILNAEIRANEAKGVESQLLLSIPRIEGSITQLRSDREERHSASRNRSAAELAETRTKIASMSATLGAQQKRLEQTEFHAPISGILKSVGATSVGQVIKPGETVAEIVPDDAPLLLQVRIRPEDIAFLREGMGAIVKLSAYDSSIFGSLKGSLKRLSADSTTDERGQTYFLADVQLSQSFIERLGEKWPIKSGMTANVEIVTGQKTVFQYITKPIHRMANAALRER